MIAGYELGINSTTLKPYASKTTVANDVAAVYNEKNFNRRKLLHIPDIFVHFIT